MAVGINAHLKIPLGYFLTKGISASQQADYVRECLNLLHATGAKVVAFTCDGPPVNLNTLKLLGANISYPNMVSKFKNPADNTDISVILNACHMLKLHRNAWGKLQHMYNENNEVKYFYHGFHFSDLLLRKTITCIIICFDSLLKVN